MEEKLKVASNGQSGDSEARLFQRCQELQAAMREKDDAIARLEQQLEEQVRTNTREGGFFPSCLSFGFGTTRKGSRKGSRPGFCQYSKTLDVSGRIWFQAWLLLLGTVEISAES